MTRNTSTSVASASAASTRDNTGTSSRSASAASFGKMLLTEPQPPVAGRGDVEQLELATLANHCELTAIEAQQQLRLAPLAGEAQRHVRPEVARLGRLEPFLGRRQRHGLERIAPAVEHHLPQRVHRRAGELRAWAQRKAGDLCSASGS